jgi:hypothetical protein
MEVKMTKDEKLISAENPMGKISPGERNPSDLRARILKPSDFSIPETQSVPYMGTNVTATTGCSQCCQ